MKRVILIGMAVLLAAVAALPAVALVADKHGLAEAERSMSSS